MVDFKKQYYQIIGFDWGLFALSTPFVLGRLYVQLRFRQRPYREIFVIAAWVLFLLYVICNTISSAIIIKMETLTGRSLDDALDIPMKVGFVQALSYKQIMYACKAALLCLYGDLAMRGTFPLIWWTIVFGWVLCISGTAVQVLATLLACLPLPLSDDWIWSGEIKCSPLRGNTYWTIATWTIHLLSDLVVFVIPFFILRNFPPKERASARAMFAIGLLNIASAILLLFFYVVPDGKQSLTYCLSNGRATFLLGFQAGSAIIIVCIPYMRRMWKGTRAGDLRPELEEKALEAAIAKVGAQDEEAQVAG